MIYPWANIIAGLRSRSTLGQISSQDFARDPPLGKHYRRTSLMIHPWANIIAGLRLQSTLGQTPSQDFTRDLALVNLICPWPIRDLPVYPCTLSFVLSRWALPFTLEIVVTGDQLTSLKIAPFTLDYFTIIITLLAIPIHLKKKIYKPLQSNYIYFDFFKYPIETLYWLSFILNYTKTKVWIFQIKDKLFN